MHGFGRGGLQLRPVVTNPKSQNPADDDLPPTLFERIEGIVLMAQDLALPPAPYADIDGINDGLIPALYEARTYIEIGRITEPEVHSGISRALRIAFRLADGNKRYNTLVNRLRILLEDADKVANDTRQMQRG